MIMNAYSYSKNNEKTVILSDAGMDCRILLQPSRKVECIA